MISKCSTIEFIEFIEIPFSPLRANLPGLNTKRQQIYIQYTEVTGQKRPVMATIIKQQKVYNLQLSKMLTDFNINIIILIKNH